MLNTTGNIEKAPGIIIIVLLVCCVWIVTVNAMVFICVLLNRYSLRKFVYMQLLSLSITDMVVGLSAITPTLTYYRPTVFAYTKTCAGIMFAYLCAQVATLFHAFGICLHRLITVKYYSGRTKSSKMGMTKRMLFQLLLIWVGSISLIAAPFGRYGQFSKPILVCSLNTLFGTNYLNFIAVFNVILITPLIGMDVVYGYMLRFLLIKWGRINNTKMTSTRTTVNDKMQGNIRLRVNNGSFGQVQEISSPRQISNRKHESLPPASIDGLRFTKKSSPFPQKRIAWTTNDTQSTQTYLNVTTDKPNTEHMDIGCNSSDLVWCTYREGQQGSTSAALPATHKSKYSCNAFSGICKRICTSATAQSQGQIERNSLRSNIKQKQVLVTIGIILLMSNIFMVPLCLTTCLELINDGLLSRKVKFILVSIALMNSGINPIINALRIKPFSDALSRNWALFVSRFRS